MLERFRELLHRKTGASPSADAVEKKKPECGKLFTVWVPIPPVHHRDNLRKPSSRLVVFSLKSDVTSSALNEYFASTGLSVTDAKVLYTSHGQSRCMGFVGYKTENDAVCARNWFDGTWFKGSRIQVDFAKVVRQTCPR